MNLVEVKIEDKEIYNRFVANAETGSFLQSWEWGEWQAALERRVFRYKMIDDSGAQIASILLIKMPLPLGKYYLYSPYGPVGSEKLKVQSEKLLQELRLKFIDAIFIRLEPKNTFNFLLSTFNSKIVKSTNIQPGKTLLIDLSKTQDELLAEMHHKTRYNIRLAQKHGVEIKDEFDISIGNGLFAKEAVNLIVETGKRQGYKGYGIEYYQKMIDCLAMQNRGDLKLHIYKAIYNNKLLSSAIMIDFPARGGSASGGGIRTFLFGGSADEDKNVMAPYLMHWQAMRDAKAAGLSQYDFWGVETSSGDVPGFVRFKLGFAPPSATSSGPSGQPGSGSTSGVKEYTGAYDLVISSFGYKLYEIFRKIKRLL